MDKVMLVVLTRPFPRLIPALAVGVLVLLAPMAAVPNLVLVEPALLLPLRVLQLLVPVAVGLVQLFKALLPVLVVLVAAGLGQLLQLLVLMEPQTLAVVAAEVAMLVVHLAMARQAVQVLLS